MTTTQQHQDPAKRSVLRPTRTWKEPTNQERLETIRQEIVKVNTNMNNPMYRCPISTMHEIMSALKRREAVLMAEIEKEKQ